MKSICGYNNVKGFLFSKNKKYLLMIIRFIEHLSIEVLFVTLETNCLWNNCWHKHSFRKKLKYFFLFTFQMEFNGRKLRRIKSWPSLSRNNMEQMHFGSLSKNIKESMLSLYPLLKVFCSTLSTKYPIQHQIIFLSF